MNAFLLGVVSSLAATALVLTAGWARSSYPRWWLVRLLSRLTGTGIARLYRTQRAAEADILHDLARARWLKVLAGRGNTLTRETFAPLWVKQVTLDSVRILLPDPSSRPDSCLQRRETELYRFDPGFVSGLLRKQVQANTEYLVSVTDADPEYELRHFNLPNAYRIIATDQAAYVTFYSRSAHGRNTPCMYVQAPGLLYDLALQVFDTAWTTGSPVSP